MIRSNLITPEGATRLRNELAYLWKTLRPEVTRALAEAAAEGDRSENAEYIYRKKQLREIDRRVRFLQKRTRELQVIDRKPPDLSRVFFGATVELENDTGQNFRYRLVGSDEFDEAGHYISIDSPMARAMLKKQVGDEFVVRTPGTVREFRITAIDY